MKSVLGEEDTTGGSAKPDEPTKVPFGCGLAWVGTKNNAFGGRAGFPMVMDTLEGADMRGSALACRGNVFDILNVIRKATAAVRPLAANNAATYYYY